MAARPDGETETKKTCRMNDLIPSSGAGLLDAHGLGSAHTTPVLSKAVKTPRGPFRCVIQLAIGVSYDVLASTDLENWTPVSRSTALDETVEFTDAQATSYSSRFYRVVAAGVSSRNCVGYAGITAPQGFVMLSNPFHNDDNTVATLLPRVPENATLCKFDTRLSRLTNNSFKAGRWSFGGERLDPGEGAIFFNPHHESINLEFAGEVMSGELINQLGQGFSIRGSMIPRGGKICTDLGLPITDGDVIHVFDRKEQRYQVHKFPVKNWHSIQPTLGLCEGFWLGKAAAGKWTQRLEATTTAMQQGVRRPV
jgi:hypothetical protein